MCSVRGDMALVAAVCEDGEWVIVDIGRVERCSGQVGASVTGV